MGRPDARILVFAKAPRPGRAKTRMAPRLGSDGAAELQAALVRHTLATATGADLAPVELWCAPPVEDAFFSECAAEFGVALHEQYGESLGERMAHALGSALHRSGHALLIGTDCPAMTAAYLETALRALSDGEDAVVGPAEDGGYVLIGLHRVAPALFNDIQWGTAEVMTATAERLDRLHLRWRRLDPLPDLDRPEDLGRLSADAHRLLANSPLRAWLEQQEIFG